MELPTVGRMPAIAELPTVSPPAPPITHRQSRELIQALHDAGWKLLITAPGIALVSHPLCDVEIPTPDYMTGSDAWPFATYSKLRQLQIVVGRTGDRIAAVFTRESACPWVRVSVRLTSFRRAVAYVREPWHPNPEEGQNDGG
jgi:hypothetical protein